MQIRSTLDTEVPEGGFFLFKGDSGEGKSTAALSFPTPFVFDFDQKMPGIAKKHFPRKQVAYQTFSDIFEVTETLNEFASDCPYETLIADSFTALANLTIDSIGQVKGETVPQMLSRVQETKNKNKQIEMMPIDYYGGEDRFCTFFINQLKKLQAKHGANPKYVIVIAHVLTVDSAPDLKTKIVTRTRSIVSKGRKVAAWLPSQFDDMYIFGHENQNVFGEATSSNEIRRMCITEAYGEDSAKCSVRGLPAQIDFTDEPLYDRMFNRVQL